MREIFTYTAKGKRESNQDVILLKDLAESISVYLLSDGMGGYKNGEIAATIACQSIVDFLTNKLDIDDVPKSIRLAVESANVKLGQKRKELESKLGTTIAGAIVCGEKAFNFWLGDVRIYHFRNSNILFQSEDHSLLNELRKNGIISPANIIRYRNIVTNSITGDNLNNKIPVIENAIVPSDIIVLCSDGLWQNWCIQSILMKSEVELIDIFSEHAYDCNDNFSIIKIDM